MPSPAVRKHMFGDTICWGGQGMPAVPRWWCSNVTEPQGRGPITQAGKGPKYCSPLCGLRGVLGKAHTYPGPRRCGCSSLSRAQGIASASPMCASRRRGYQPHCGSVNGKGAVATGQCPHLPPVCPRVVSATTSSAPGFQDQL